MCADVMSSSALAPIASAMRDDDAHRELRGRAALAVERRAVVVGEGESVSRARPHPVTAAARV